MTPIKAIKVAIALAPALTRAARDGQSAGGLTTANGWVHGVLPSIGNSYTGFNAQDGKFEPAGLVYGYVPLAGAWAFGKVASRVLRI